MKFTPYYISIALCLSAVTTIYADTKKSADQTITDLIAKTSIGSEKLTRFSLKNAENVPAPALGNFSKIHSFEDTFEKNWEKTQTSWDVATWEQNGAIMARERCRTNGEGLIIQTVKAGAPYLGGSMQTAQEFGYGRWIARVKPSAVPGVLNSIFTKDWDDLTTPTPTNDGLMGEIDIEFLTDTFGPNHGEVHLAIHLSNRPNLWHIDAPIDFNPSDAFHEWGFDILPDRVVWHVDGKKLAEWLYTEEDSIDLNYEFFFNSWTKKEWIGGPPEEDAHYEIDWVRFYPLQLELEPTAATSPALSSKKITHSEIKKTNTEEGARIERFEINSPSMGRPIKVALVLPQDYDNHPDQKFPVLYALHGSQAPHDTWTQMPLMRKELADMPFIIMCFDADSNSFYLDAEYPQKTERSREPEIAKQTSLHTTFFFDELIPTVESLYRIDPKKRGITGFSMGGFGAFHYMLIAPEMFTSVSSLSGFFLDARSPSPKDQKYLKPLIGSYDAYPERYEAIGQYQRLTDACKNNQPIPPIYLHCGSDDFLLEMNQKMAAHLKSLDLEIQYKEDAGGHNWDFWYPASVNVAKFHWQHFQK